MAVMEVKLNGSKVKLKEGMMLYSASHGPVKVVSIEEKEFFGEKEKFCEMKSELEDIKILVPISKMRRRELLNVKQKCILVIHC